MKNKKLNCRNQELPLAFFQISESYLNLQHKLNKSRKALEKWVQSENNPSEDYPEENRLEAIEHFQKKIEKSVDSLSSYQPTPTEVTLFGNRDQLEAVYKRHLARLKTGICFGYSAAWLWAVLRQKKQPAEQRDKAKAKGMQAMFETVMDGDHAEENTLKKSGFLIEMTRKGNLRRMLRNELSLPSAYIIISEPPAQKLGGQAYQQDGHAVALLVRKTDLSAENTYFYFDCNHGIFECDGDGFFDCITYRSEYDPGGVEVLPLGYVGLGVPRGAAAEDSSLQGLLSSNNKAKQQHALDFKTVEMNSNIPIRVIKVNDVGFF